MRIKDMNQDTRPREKAVRYGMEVLSDQELLCLMIGSGTPACSVMQIASGILEETSQLQTLFDLHLSTLMKIPGVGRAKALQILASVELAKRALKADVYKKQIWQASDAAEWMQAEYGTRMTEHFVCVYLDTRGQIISHKILSIGTISQSLIHPREIFREAYLQSANSVFFAHNHPSGDISPSASDIQTTEKLMRASLLSDIPILDHLIVSKNAYFSFRENGLLDIPASGVIEDPMECIDLEKLCEEVD